MPHFSRRKFFGSSPLMGFLRFKNHGQGITGSASVLLSKRLLSPVRAKKPGPSGRQVNARFCHRISEAMRVRSPDGGTESPRFPELADTGSHPSPLSSGTECLTFLCVADIRFHFP